MRWTRYGPDALMFQFADHIGDEAFQRSRAITAELEQRPPAGLTEFVPAFTTVLLEFDPRVTPDPSRIADELSKQLERAAEATITERPVRKIPVLYDGPDLSRVAQKNNLSVEEVCALHSAPIYKVYFLGFSPGFPYLGDLHPRLQTPRLPSPRVRVPPGSVAIGGQHTGIYTVESPGGWNIIGATPVRIFDPSLESADGDTAGVFLLRPGDRVQFVPISGTGVPP
jgi:inhibitor of KinA